MRIFVIIVLALLFINTHLATGQKIDAENIQWKVVEGYVVLTFDLPDSTGKKDISIVLKRTSDPQFSFKPKMVAGDIGQRNISGPGRKIYWDYLSDIPEGLKGNDYYFEVTVEIVSQEEKGKSSLAKYSSEKVKRFRMGVTADFYMPSQSRIGIEMVGGGGISLNYILPVKGAGIGIGLQSNYLGGEFAYINGAGTIWKGMYSEANIKPQVFFTNLLTGRELFKLYYKAGLSWVMTFTNLVFDNDESNYTGMLKSFEFPLGLGFSVAIGKRVYFYSGAEINISPTQKTVIFYIDEEGAELNALEKSRFGFSYHAGITF